ncbi:MmcQ/YjbR family DNA-binding protein [Caldimonas brevitalea]|uniref:MmcQ/YjbR family DNA-binding protein n=1 Tax=Caldimonas brevitalea TaxID=413882 RepID=A0A0G3BQB2_9BURK|nr:MmcQ/YjbR family DNA-binding protein [Caldimonas brevitalea]AKJ30173.1 hypothetical protein AAW51_3482 [Caldimonas brevitalea]
MKFAEVRRHAMALPEVTEEPHHQYSSFRVRGKIFVTVPPDKEHLHIFVDEPHREQALALYPEFLEKVMWGGKVVGVRASLPSASPSVIRTLVRQAWQYKAPKSLVAASDPGRPSGGGEG